MGKSTKSETGPSKFAQPYISQAANAVQGAYQANQGNISNISDILRNNTDSVVGSTLNNPNLAAANSYNNNVLSGQYLNGNPNLQAIIDQTNGDVANKVNASIGSRGGAGGSAQAQLLARELANNESTLRYNNYNTERTNQQQAVGNAANLSNAGNQGIATLLSYLTGSATLPQAGAESYASSIGSLLGNSTTTTASKSFGASLQDYLTAAAATAAKVAGG